MNEFQNSFIDRPNDYICNTVIKETDFYGSAKIHKSSEILYHKEQKEPVRKKSNVF